MAEEGWGRDRYQSQTREAGMEKRETITDYSVIVAESKSLSDNLIVRDEEWGNLG